MPVSRTAFLSSTALFILLGLAALLAIVGAAFWLVNQAEINAEIVAKALRQRTVAVDLRGFIDDAETGQRGYLLTGAEDYLKPYLDARTKFPEAMERARDLLGADPETKQAFERLSLALSGKMSELERTLALDKAGRHDDALALVRTDVGRDLMDEARAIFARLIALSDNRITVSVEKQRTNIANLRNVTVVSALAIIIIIGGSFRAALVYTRNLIQARSEVAALNANLEQRVRERTVDLARANEEIQRFAYVVTHDLRAPLVNIMGFTSELEIGLASIQAEVGRDGAGAAPLATEAKLAAFKEIPEAIAFVRSSTKKMDGLINAILKLSREGRRVLRPEAIDLDALFRSAVANIRHELVEAGGEVLIEANPPPLVSDRLALEQIFGNLLDNAVKYRQPDRPLQIRIRAKSAHGARVLVEIEDNGRGVAAQDHERVFDLFRRSGIQDQRGEGIGLPHVRAIVRNLGGEIALVSALGVGATFAVSIAADLRKVIGAT